MFLDLAKQLPRFHAYAHVLHTPRLHESLRRVYGLLIDFCVKVVEFQQSPQLCETNCLGATSLILMVSIRYNNTSTVDIIHR